MTVDPLKIIAIFVLLFLSAFFSCSETAFFSLTRAQINEFKRSKRGVAASIIRMLQHPRKTLVTILLGNELVNVALAILVASVIYDLIGDASWKISTVISIIVAVPMILIFGEVVPKNIAVRYAASLLPILIVPLSLFYRIVFPIRYLLSAFADQVVRLFGGDPTQLKTLIMEEEFRQLVDMGYREGVLEEGESELIHRVFELGNMTVTEIMTPGGEVFHLPIDLPLDQIIREMRETQYSRIPVYRNNDADIIGALHSRDVFRLYRGRQRGHMQDIEEIVRPIHVVGVETLIDDLLADFQRLKIHIAVVKNNEGEIVGLVTMDDIFRLLFTEKLEKKGGKIANRKSQITSK